MLTKIKTLALVCLFIVSGTNTLLAQVFATAGVNEIVCAGGTVTIGGSPTATGGVPPYTYAWAPGVGLSSTTVPDPQASPTVTTTYTVTVTDGNAQTATAAVTVTVNESPQIDSLHIVNVSCNDSATGSVCVYASGGGSFTYVWSNTGTGQCINHLASGTYTVTVTNAAGCSITAGATVSQPAPLTATFTNTNVTCNGQSNGNINAIVTGGLAPYEYEWSNGAFNVVTLQSITSGLYSLTIVDANGCTISNSTSVTQPAALHDSIVVTNVSCFGGNNGSLCNLLTGGTPPYTFTWSNAQASACITALQAGIYTTTVTDNNGCTATGSATVSQPAVAFQLDSISVTDVSCNGGFNGALCAYVTNGATPYTYIWSNSATTQCITSLSTGIWTTTVEDANGCSVSGSATITQPQALTLNVTGTSDNALPDTATLVATGGTVPYTVTWGDGQNSNLTGTSGSHIYSTAGIDTITLTDAHGCNTTYSLLVDSVPPLIANAGANATICLYNNIILGGNPTATGGTPPYAYLWSDGVTSTANPVTAPSMNHTYTLTVTDANSVSATSSITVTVGPALNSAFSAPATCLSNATAFTDLSTPAANISAWSWDFGDGATSTTENPSHTFATAGTYPVTLAVTNGQCTADTTISISISALPTSPFTATSPACIGQNSTITFTGTASANATFTWNFDGATISSGTGAGPYEVNWSTGGTKNVTLSIIDGGCTSLLTTEPIAVNPTPGLALQSDATICNGGSVMLTASGAVSYTWSPATGLNSSNTATVIAGPAVTTTYTVTGSSSGCSATASVIVNVSRLTDSLDTHNVSCTGTGDGSICAYITGGTTPYTYVWSNGFNSACITSLSPAIYNLTVTDANGCTADTFVSISQPVNNLQLTPDSHVNLCSADSNSTLCATVTGGTQPYTYQWKYYYPWNNYQGTASTACLSSVKGGDYWYVVTDANGCTDSFYYSIPQVSQLNLLVAAPDTNAVPDSISILISGGRLPYAAFWGDGQTSNLADSTGTHIYNAGGVYTDSIKDGNGCVLTFTIDAGCTDQCVWPGDANYDGVVDNNDLLAIGLGYDTTGPARLNPTINFIPQYCASWADTLTGAINYKHVDCNGDGIINATDTNAILLNYSLVHPRGGGSGGWKAEDPALYITTSPDTISDGQILTATLSLGNQALPVSGTYALAFTYNFDPLVVDTTDVQFTVGNSWLFGAGDHINISKNFYQQGQVQAAITRIDHANRSGYGPIATISMKITTGNINGKNLQYYLMKNFISNLTVIDDKGNVTGVNEGTDSAVISYLPTSIIPVNPAAHIQIFPNPASDQLNVVSGLSEIEEITIVDLTGQQVIHQNMQAGNYSVIDISQLSAGVYLIKLKTAKDEYHSRFVKAGVK